jgi:hypothetical protein
MAPTRARRVTPSPPSPTPPRKRGRWARPGVVLPIVATIALILALLTPQSSVGRVGDPRLSSHHASSLGARLLAETAARLGFLVSARAATPSPDSAAQRGTTIHAVLAPSLPVSPEEAHAYLEAVRAGDALLLALDRRNALSDSLGARHTGEGGVLHSAPKDTLGCRPRRDFVPPLWADGFVHLYGLRWVRGEPAKRVVFAQVLPSALAGPVSDAAVGFPVGRGRVVVVADPDLLRNDVLRRCAWGADVIAVRMLEWLRAGGDAPRTALVFDEFHQGYGPAPSTGRVVRRFLVEHPAGRTLLALVAAGLILLLAMGPRPLSPREAETIERRDPLEQVDALAHAYEQVGASRTIAARLLRGVRWRVDGPSSAAHRRPDDVFLAEVEAAAPDLAADVALIRRALREPLSPRDLPDLGAALRRLEDTLTTTRA